MTSRSHSLFVNALTFSRVPLIFAFMVFAVVAEWRQCWAWTIPADIGMLLAGITDLLDGRLARRWKVVSTFGKLADPLMDKVFFIVSFPTLLWLIGMQGDCRVHFAVMLVFTVLYILRDRSHLRLPRVSPLPARQLERTLPDGGLRGRGVSHRPERLFLRGLHACLLALYPPGHWELASGSSCLLWRGARR